MNKSIAEIAKEVLLKNHWELVMWGDCFILDSIAEECKHTNLMDLHPLNRHNRILSALQKSKLFKTSFVQLNGKRGNQLVRACKIIPTNGETKIIE